MGFTRRLKELKLLFRHLGTEFQQTISINNRKSLEPQPSFHIEFTREMSVPSHPIPFHDGSDTKVLRETPKDVARKTHVKCNIQKCTIEKNTVSKLGRCSAPVKEGISWGSPLISWSLKMHEFGCCAYWKARCEWDRKDFSVVPHRELYEERGQLLGLAEDENSLHVLSFLYRACILISKGFN